MTEAPEISTTEVPVDIERMSGKTKTVVLALAAERNVSVEEALTILMDYASGGGSLTVTKSAA